MPDKQPEGTQAANIKYREIYDGLVNDIKYLKESGQCRAEIPRSSKTHDTGFYDALNFAYRNPTRYIPIMAQIVRDATLDGFQTKHYLPDLEELVDLLDALNGKIVSW